MDTEINKDLYTESRDIISSIRHHAANSPGKSAYIFLENDKEQSKISYGDLYNRIKIFASHLDRYSGQRAILLIPSEIDYVIAFFACLMAKVVAVPAYPPTNDRNSGRISSIIDSCDARLLISTPKVADTLNKSDGECWSGLHKITTDFDSMRVAEFLHSEISSQDIAFLQYTSGSISDPKGVILTHSNIMHNMRHILKFFNANADTVTVSWLPLYHDMGLIGSIVHNAYLGGTCVFMSPQSFLQKPDRWLRAISDYRATVSGAPNFAYEYCVQKIDIDKCCDIDLSSWDVAYNGAEPVHVKTLEMFGEKFSKLGMRKSIFLPCYGMAESTLFVAGERNLRTLSLSRQSYSKNKVEVSDGPSAIRLVGYTIDQSNYDIAIVDSSTGRIRQNDVIGEVWLKSDSVGQGYWGKPKISDETFQAYSACGSGPYLRTGDLGFKHNGGLFVTGRLKDIIIVHGQNYYPQDLEYCALHSDYALLANSCAAFPIENADGETFILAIENPKNIKSDFLQLSIKIRKKLVEIFGIQPEKIIFVRKGDIPKTSSGKIKHKACVSLYLNNSFNVIYVNALSANEDSLEMNKDEFKCTKGVQEKYPVQDVEKYLINLFADLLKHEERSMTSRDSLFELGLESISGVEASYRISREFSVPFEPSMLVDMPTIKDVADAIIRALLQKESEDGNESGRSESMDDSISVVAAKR